MHNCIPKSIAYSLIFISVLASAQVLPHRAVLQQPVQKKNGITIKDTKSKVHPLHKKLRSKIFGNAHADVFLNHHTTFTGNKARITFDLELGTPVKEKKSLKFSGSNAKEFSGIEWTNIQINKLPSGVSYTSIGKPGEPEIPALSFVISIPENASGISPFIDQVSTSQLTNTFLLPKLTAKGERIYSSSSYLSPANYVPLLSSPATLRTMRIISLTIPLLECNVRSGIVKVKKKFSCGVTFTVLSQITSAATYQNNDPVFEELYSKIAANVSDVNKFRTSFHRSQSKDKIQSSNNPTFDRSIINWIDPSAPYIKLVATRTGLYRITPAEIQSRSGFSDIASWKQSEVRIFNKGKEIPIWIDSTADGKINAIEYYGERLAGYPGEYYNWDSDSNAYWLTNTKKFQTSPLRYKDKVVSGSSSVTISEGNITLHHEQDNFYYGGDAGGDESATLQRCEWVPGERFIWQYFSDGIVMNPDTFMISSLPSTIAGKTAQVTVFLRGVSSSTTSITHNASIFINDSNVSNPPFADFNEMYDVFTVPLSLLRKGVNTFRVAYQLGSLTPDKWYLDYYSISLPTGLTASSDTAIAQGQWAFSITPSQQQFNIGLQVSSDIPHLYNLSDGSKLIPVNSTPVYKDAANDTARYVAATTASFLHPDRIVNVSGTFAAILDTTQGADYILITHPLFYGVAQRLEAHRKKTISRTKIVTTDDIFNAFNFGSDEPWALRRYLQYAYDFYAGTPPAFVTLLGDGTWDPKFNLNNPLQDNSTKTIHQSFVPTFGVPNSDYIFSAVEGSGIDSATFRMIISRIPVETPDEAQNYLDKLIDYETSLPAQWNKNFLFVSGGDPGFQSGQLSQYEQFYVTNNQYGGLGNPPISINPTFISRQDLIDQVDITQIPAIQTAFKAGQSLAYFFGHGSPSITDVQFPDVGTLRNSGTYPVFITVSCRTGAFAEPNLISMNESFVRVPDAGAILAFGSTGFGEVNYDFNMSAAIFNFLRQDSSIDRMPSTGPHKINFPIICTISKFIESILAPPTGGYGQHNSLYEYSILGDAAMGFDLRPQPEFNITASDIILSGKDGNPRSVFSVSDSEITVKATIHNYGYGITTPVHVQITDQQPGNRPIILIDTIESLENIATTGAILTLDSFAIGSNTLDIFVDYDSLFAETNENDNEVSVNFLVNGVSAAPFYPPEGSKYFCDIRTDSVNIILLLPNNASGGSTTIELQFDTTSAFNSGALADFTGLKGSGIFFQKSFSRSALPNPVSHVVWWRSRITLQSGSQSAWQAQSFSLDAPKPSNARSEFSYSTGDQLANTIISGLQVDKSDGSLFIPKNDTVYYEVDAQGSNNTNVVGGQPVGQIFIDGKPVYLTPFKNGHNFNGVILAELTPDGSGIQQIFEFNKPDIDDPNVENALADTFAMVIAGFPAGRGVIIFTNFQGVIPNFACTDTVTSALRSIGSTNGMCALQYFGSYALMGKKGLPKGSAKESFGNVGLTGAKVSDTIITLGTSGVAQTPLTAVATGYGNLKWKTQNLSPGSTVKFTVLGVRKSTGAIDTLLKTDAASGQSADLSVIPASVDDQLFVQMNFQRDSSSTVSPRLNLIELEYDPAPEFNTGDSLIFAVPKNVIEGNSVTVTYQVQNVSCVDAQHVPVQLFQTYHGTSVILANDTITNFPGHSAVSFTHTIPTSGFQGDVNLTATINPGGILNEHLLFNNTAHTIYTVTHDSAKPQLDLVFDSRHINSGDYVSSKVQIEIRLSTNNPLRVNDSTAIGGVLQALFGSKGTINFSGTIKNDSFTTQFKTLPSGTIQATLDITPQKPLQPGRYLFTAMGHDANGNRSDTISDEFVVSNTNGLDEVMNYPNPFKDKTWFTFILKAGSQATVKTVIYTVAGRKIRTLYLDPTKQHAGLNSIEWDGRDEMGNEIANGTYLYRIVLNGTNDDGSLSSDATTERAVKSK